MAIMSSLNRSISGVDIRTVVAVAGSVAVVGVAYGALAASAGLMWWQTVLIACCVYAASAEFLFVGALVAGAGPLVGALSGLLVNARTVIYGISAAEYIPPGGQALIAAHLINDETVALAGASGHATRRAQTFWVSGMSIWVAWVAGAASGAVLGGLVDDPGVWGLDAVFPTLLAVLVMPMMADRRVAACVVAAGFVAVVVVVAGGVPSGLGPLLATSAVPVVWFLARKRNSA